MRAVAQFVALFLRHDLGLAIRRQLQLRQQRAGVGVVQVFVGVKHLGDLERVYVDVERMIDCAWPPLLELVVFLMSILPQCRAPG